MAPSTFAHTQEIARAQRLTLHLFCCGDKTRPSFRPRIQARRPAIVHLSSVRTFMPRGTYVLRRLRTPYLHGARLLAPNSRTTANDRPHLAMAYLHTDAHHVGTCIYTSMACMDRIIRCAPLVPHSTMHIADPIHTEPTHSLNRGRQAHTIP